MQTVWSRIRITQGDITREKVDAIVNAANSRLAGGGGVDGAIHRAAGPELLAACRKLGGCETGDAKITPGFRLPARFVIHAVGPVYHDGRRGEPELLASCYRRALEIAIEHGLKTIAFPAISTGVYGYPFAEATQIALRTVATFLREHPEIKQVRLVFFSAGDYEQAVEIFERLSGAPA
jgi:O-acetyl-ADP-ribose deacetylase (regulator of RNase III)